MHHPRVEQATRGTQAVEEEDRVARRHHNPHRATVHRRVGDRMVRAAVVVAQAVEAAEAEEVEEVIVAEEAAVVADAAVGVQEADNIEVEKLMRGMMKTNRVLLALGILFALTSTKGFAQYPEDALRLSLSGLSVGARALGMGGAYTGVANDFTAIYWNPAGLGQIRQFELSGGVGHLGYSNDATFLGQSSNYSNSSTSISNAGFVYPIPTRRGSFTLAFGYNRSADFTTALAFNGFNNASSIVPSLYNPDETQDLAWQLYLEDTTGYSPIQRNVNQRGKVLENDGLNNWSVAGALEIAPRFFLGATLTLLSGSYSYIRNYTEEDSKNLYTTPPFDIQQLNLDNTIDWDLSGYGFKIGMLYKARDLASFGLTMKLPSRYTVKEKFQSDGTSIFKTPDKNGNYQYSASVGGNSEYDVQTPFVFGGGVSINAGGFVFSGDAEYTDWSEMEFKNPSSNISNLTSQNTDIKNLFRATTNLRAGAEYTIPEPGVRLRAGFAYQPSPYEGDPSSFAQKYITGGIGFAVESSVFIDVAYAHGWWDTFHVNYDETSRTDEKVKTDNLLFNLSYRF
jgi:long-subunit fatty acid transport protein